jgi:hypothetical protein
VFDRKRIARDLDEELELHLALEIENNIERGMLPMRAPSRGVRSARAALSRETRDARGVARLGSSPRDLRVAAVGCGARRYLLA